MRFPVGEGSQQDFDKNWYSADKWDTWRGTYYHGGEDVNKKTGGNTDCGEKIYAVADGEITSVEILSSGFGKHIHQKVGSVWFHYAHCQDVFVSVGQRVVEGQLIATIGSTGNSKYCHLHLEGKKKPVGVNAVAKTLFQLQDGWFNPLDYIREHSQVVPTPPGGNMTHEQFYNKFLESFRKHRDDIEWGDDKHKFEAQGLQDDAMIGRMLDAVAADRVKLIARIKELENQPVPAPVDPGQPPVVVGWEANGLQVQVGDKTWNYAKK